MNEDAPCPADQPPLKGEDLQKFSIQLCEGWDIVDEHHLRKSYQFKNFKEALGFSNEVGKIAEEMGHHPEVAISWGSVKLLIWTHTIDGLSESDFTLASKCEAAYIAHLN